MTQDTVITNSPEETKQFAKDFLASLTPRIDGATIVALEGDLGAGKTTFTQGLAETLGITETVVSPTFVIEKIYEINHAQFTHLIHIDAYRIEKSNELVSLGWNTIASDPHNLIFVEWPERISDILPSSYTTVYITGTSLSTREIRVQYMHGEKDHKDTRPA